MIWMARYDFREGDIATAGAYSKLTLIGPETRNAVVVPAGMNSVKQITGVFHFDTTDAEGAVCAVRLTGLKFGNYETVLGGYTNGTAVANGADAAVMMPMVINTNLAVVPGAEMWIESTMIGTATAGSCDVELTFDAAQGEKRYGFIRTITVAAPGTKTAANSDATSATAYGIKIPSDATRISSMIPFTGGVTLATASGGIAVVTLEGGLTAGDISLTAGGHSGLATTAGLCAGYYEVDQIQTNVKVSPGSIIQVYSETKGTDWGTPSVGIAIEMATSDGGGPEMTYRERDLLVGGVDTWVLLTAIGANTTPGPLTVPSGFNRILQVIHAEGDSTPTAASRNHGTLLRLTGVAAGEAIIVLSGLTGAGVTGGNAGTTMGAWRRDVDIPLKAGIISPYIDMSSGVDTSAPYSSITLGFAK